MKRAIFPSVIGWLVGTVSMVVGFYLGGEYHADQMGLLEFLLRSFLILGAFVAIVVFPICILVVAPLLKLLPESSILWRPVVAAPVGAVLGFLAMYLLIAVYLREILLPIQMGAIILMFGGAAFLVGATFAYLYATSAGKSRKPVLP